MFKHWWHTALAVVVVGLVACASSSESTEQNVSQQKPGQQAAAMLPDITPSGIGLDACIDAPLTGLQSNPLTKASISPVALGSTSVVTNQLPDGVLRIHYQRAGDDYAGWGLHVWNQAGDAVTIFPTWDNPVMPAGSDDFGVYYDLPIQNENGIVGYIFHLGDLKDHNGADQFYTLGNTREIWRKQNDQNTYEENPDLVNTTPDSDYLRVHYKRYAGDYDGFGLHIWEFAGGQDIDRSRLPPGIDIGIWPEPVPFAEPMISGVDAFGVWVDIPIKKYSEGARGFNFLVHKGVDDAGKDGGDRVAVFASGYEIWLLQGDNTVYTEPPRGSISTTEAKAYWVDERTLLWPRVDGAGEFRLYFASQGGISADEAIANADGYFALNVIANEQLPDDLQQRYQYLNKPYTVLQLQNLPEVFIKRVLKSQLVIAHFDSDGVLNDASSVQTAGVIDALYADAAKNEQLGVKAGNGAPQFKLWAPTAKNVAVCIYDQGNEGNAFAIRQMRQNPHTGVWSVQGSPNWNGKYYRYVVVVIVRRLGTVQRNLVTDPYSISLSANSQRSWIGSLNDSALKPSGWNNHSIPPLAAPEDISIYEMHVRDFSAYDQSVPENHRGKFKAFTHTESNGMQHLQALAEAGLSHLHLLPVNDIATIPEVGCVQPVIPDAAPDSEAQQAAVFAVRDQDCFNWGYDPLHYNVPEGSYATDASDAAVRVREFREMVQALHQAGLRVAIDVVYNHTPAAGQDQKSVLDKIVPDYYHRLDDRGNVANSTCCANTATENAMMAKLMIDSAVLWAKEYKVDALRFDLMGHQPLSAMLELEQAVNQAAGREIYLYGEGWNFGEVANDARFIQATQKNLAGTGIGSFSDRARDSARGGSSFDGGNALIANQGVFNGLYLDNNGMGSSNVNDLLWHSDMIRLGLAGTLKQFSFQTFDGSQKRGDEIYYGGAPAGYALDPQEIINYVDKHDNQTLYDINAYKLPEGTSKHERARAQLLGIAYVALAQGVPFFHAGMDLLRSKSLDRDSYNSGDWFNKLDFTYQQNNFGVGAPIAEKNQENWWVIKPLLANPNLKPHANDIAFTHAVFKDLLKLRNSSTLFRMRSGEDVVQRLRFANTGPGQQAGVIAMLLDGENYAGANFRRIVVLFNIDKNERSLSIAGTESLPLSLHPVQQQGADARVKVASFNAGQFTVPARTVAVFVQEN